MSNISYVSATLDYIAYIAKASPGSASLTGPFVPSRACYVLECGGGLVQDVITTIGQSFELSFNPPPPIPQQPPLHPDDPQYDNDLPNQAPPNNAGQRIKTHFQVYFYVNLNTFFNLTHIYIQANQMDRYSPKEVSPPVS